MQKLYSALLVPFDEQGNVIEDGLREVVRQNIEIQKVDGLYVNGSTAENFMMSTEQKKHIFKVVSEEVDGRVKLIAQVGSLNLNEAIALGKYATDLKYDYLSAVTPFYYPFTFTEIKDYYDEIIKATNSKMIIYSIPALTGTNIKTKQFEKLFENEKIVGVKFTNNDLFSLERLRKSFPDKMIFSGFDEMLIYGLLSNVDGAIGSTYNVNGKRAKQIINLFNSGEITEAFQEQQKYNDFIEEVLDIGIYQSLKEVLKQKGINAGVCKKPMNRLSENEINRVKNIIKEHNL